MPGQVTIRIRNGELVTPRYYLLNVSAAELAGLAGPTGWRIETLLPDPPEVYAVLAKV